VRLEGLGKLKKIHLMNSMINFVFNVRGKNQHFKCSTEVQRGAEIVQSV
jgi:hypothetical protein